MPENFSLISIGVSEAEVLSVLGQPEKRAENTSGSSMLIYDSLNSSLANVIYINQGKVILVSRSEFLSQKTLDTLLDKVDQPSESFIYKNPSRETNRSLVLHIWEKDGLAVLTTGDSVDSYVERVFLFEKNNKEQFLQNWQLSKYLQEPTKLVIKSENTSITSMTQLRSTVSNYFHSNELFSLLILNISFIVFIIGLMLYKKKHKKR